MTKKIKSLISKDKTEAIKKMEEVQAKLITYGQQPWDDPDVIEGLKEMRAIQEREAIQEWEAVQIGEAMYSERKAIEDEIDKIESIQPNTIAEYDNIKHRLDELYKKLNGTDDNQTDDYRENPDEQIRDADNQQTLRVANYIQQQRADGIQDEIIAHKLHDENGTFKLTYAVIAKKFGLDGGLNESQYITLKKRGERFCNKGKNMLKKR